MKPGNDSGVAGLLLFAALCELVCELLSPYAFQVLQGR